MTEAQGCGGDEVGGDFGGADEAGTRVHNRLTDSTVHGAVVQAGRADIVLRATEPVEPAVPVTVAPPLGLRDTSRPLRGRADALARLEAAAPAGDRLLVLCGMGGCGKTTLALELAARRTEAGCRVWWVEARNGPALEAALRAVARQAGAAAEELERGDTADVLWSHLDRLDAPWLLVVDNADDPALLDGPGALNAGTGWIRPATGAGTVLVTTRESTPATWGPAARLHPLQPLTGERLAAAARILRDHAPDTAGTEAEAHALAARLGGLPLALRLAGTYLTEAGRTPAPFRAPGTPTTYADYRRAWEDGPRGLDPAHVLPRTWAMSLDLLDQRGHAHARGLLELIASFADADLPYTLLLTPDRLADAGPLATLDGPALWQHLTALAALGLIDLPDPAPDTLPVLRMHPLVRDASRTAGAGRTALRLLVVAALAEETGAPEDAEFGRVWRLLSPHVLDGFHRVDTGSLDDEDFLEITDAVDLAVRHLWVGGLLTQARAEYEAVLALERERVDDTHPDLLVTRRHFARVLRDLGEFEAARAELEEVLAIECERAGETHPGALNARHDLALVLAATGESEAARAAFEAVLAARRAAFGDAHPFTLATRHELAQILHDQGELAAARAEFEAILAVRDAASGRNHPGTLVTWHRLALVLRDLGEAEAARAEFEAILAARRGGLGEDAPESPADFAKIAQLLYDLGELEEARAAYELALANRKERSETHPDTLVIRHNLAVVRLTLGELEAALAELKAVVAHERERWGDTHLAGLPARRSLALALLGAGERQAARAELEAILRIQHERLGEDHPYTRAAREDLAGARHVPEGTA
ncbi:tetratricopeptide repeat protein [Kitasatospora sp. NPDC059462]|uniref:tetratricopeptide repeat protein n=1 Tax=Kitasatospora sp. NPDC059462 TaxID=3346841 RepID=UPI0036BD6269